MSEVDYLDMPPSEMPEATVLESGIYRFQVGPWRRDKVGEDQKSKVTISAKPIEIVNSEMGEEQFHLAENMRLVYWLTEKAVASRAPHISMTKFLTEVLGLPEELPTKELLEMALGLTFTARVVKKMGGRNNDQPEVEVARFIAETTDD